jgi:peroxiredoxin
MTVDAYAGPIYKERMSLTYSPQGKIGSPLPDFNLPSVDGKNFSPKDFKFSPALLIMFICNHCPYVKAIEGRLIDLARNYQGRGLSVVAICANDPAEYPEDSPIELLNNWRAKKYGFPYLIDGSQKIAKAFGAVCTPDIYLYDSKRNLAYRGRLDDSWKNEQLVRRQELKEAVEAVLSGNSVNPQQNPSMGCSIKWKS